MHKPNCNLLAETVNELSMHDKDWHDVRYILCRQSKFEINAETLQMLNFEYDGGYGLQNVEPTLKIIGYDWWMERHAYDGSEWWEFKSFPEGFGGFPYPWSTFRNHDYAEPDEFDDYTGDRLRKALEDDCK